MYKYCICILYCYFTRFPDGQCREKQKGGGQRGLSNYTYSTSGGGEKRAQCLDLSIGRSTLCQINPGQIGRKRREGGRESRGAEGGPARPPRLSLCYSVGWSSVGQLVCLLAGLLSVRDLLVLLPSSLPG